MSRITKVRGEITLPLDVKRIIAAKNPDELKCFGSFKAVKCAIKNDLGAYIRAGSWMALHQKLHDLKTLIPELENQIETAIRDYEVEKSIKLIHRLTGLEFSCGTQDELERKITSLRALLSVSVSDPFLRFEKNKVKNFINSSKLEGLDLEPADPSETMNSILAKYKQN